jgi:hypothetical protein
MPPLAQHGLRQPRAPGSDSGRRPAGRGYRPGATTPTTAILAVWLLAASARLTNSPGSDTADAERPDSARPDAQMPGRPTGHRTPDTGRRTPTPDSGHPDAWTPTQDTGHRTRSRGHRTRGHWTLTPDTGRRMLLRPDRLTRHGQLRIFWAITPSGCPLGCRTVFLRTAPAALGVPCSLGGEATCQCAKLPIALSAAARSLRRPSGASAHCSPRTISGRE